MLIEDTEMSKQICGLRLVFFTFLECPQMSGVFYHSVIHGFRLLHLLYDIDFGRAKQYNTPFLCFILCYNIDKTLCAL